MKEILKRYIERNIEMGTLRYRGFVSGEKRYDFGTSICEIRVKNNDTVTIYVWINNIKTEDEFALEEIPSLLSIIERIKLELLYDISSTSTIPIGQKIISPTLYNRIESLSKNPIVKWFFSK